MDDRTVTPSLAATKEVGRHDKARESAAPQPNRRTSALLRENLEGIVSPRVSLGALRDASAIAASARSC